MQLYVIIYNILLQYYLRIINTIHSKERQYGTILCFANNNVGRQKDPCAFHLIPAGKIISIL